MDRTGQFLEGPLAKPIIDLIGGNIEAYDGLPEGASAQIEMDDRQYDWSVWGDLLYAEETTRILATYADQFYAGAAAVLQKRHGETLNSDLLRRLPRRALRGCAAREARRQLELPGRAHASQGQYRSARCLPRIA